MNAPLAVCQAMRVNQVGVVGCRHRLPALTAKHPAAGVADVLAFFCRPGLQTALFDVQPKLSIHIRSTRSRLEAFDELCGSLGRHR
jgi:hypothetical protein